MTRALVAASRVKRRARDLVHARVRLRAARRRGFDRLEPDAAKAQPRSVRTRARLRGDRDRHLRKRPRFARRRRALLPSRPSGNQSAGDSRNRARARRARLRSPRRCRTCTGTRTRWRERAGDGYVVATDIADALIARGVSPRQAHLLVGNAVQRRRRRRASARSARPHFAHEGGEAENRAQSTARSARLGSREKNRGLDRARIRRAIAFASSKRSSTRKRDST